VRRAQREARYGEVGIWRRRWWGRCILLLYVSGVDVSERFGEIEGRGVVGEREMYRGGPRLKEEVGLREPFLGCWEVWHFGCRCVRKEERACGWGACF